MDPQQVESEHRSLREEQSVVSAAGLMIGGSAVFAVLGALVKAASNEATAMQAVLYRSVFSALPLIVLLRLRGVRVVSARWRLLLLRGVVGFAALFCFLWGLSHVKMANAIALQQTSPIFVAFLSIVLLRERPRAWYFPLAALCLIGAVLVVRPDRGIAALESSVPLLAALFSSLAYVSVRSLTSTESSLRIVAWFVLVSSLGALPFCLADWHWLSLRANVLLAIAGLLATLGQLMMTAAYRRAPAWIVSVFSYSSVPLGWTLGMVFWGERPDSLATLGIVLIVCGGVLVAYKLRGHGRTSVRRVDARSPLQ